jgi:SWI/SNF-related matrix-associated actin-dependent regulator 1 of chromatin subfamily A
MESALTKFTLVQEDLFCSPKLERLRTFLPQLVKDGHRILIFSQWTRCLDLLGCFLDSIDFRFLRLDGSTNIRARQTLIDEFNNDVDIPVFLLSTRAGGMGINLTAADTCIIHDLDFNPFNDLQAEDRCHRIGQTKDVTVYKMITEGSVDADIHAMQERKAEMTAAIFDNENNDKAGGAGAADLKKPSKKAASKQEDEDVSTILKATFDRYNMHSPPKKKGKGKSSTSKKR